MDITETIVLGLVQGITEFLPVSSSGHLVIVRDFLQMTPQNKLAFDALLHLATTAAIVVYFWSDIWSMIQTLIRKLGRLPVNEKDIVLLNSLFFATLPGVFLGLILEPIMETYFYTPLIVAGVLAFAAIFFMYAEWRYYVNPPQGTLTVKKGVMIGLFQALALIPGFSRSGATLAGGMLLGLSRIESARFSFLLAIPITAGLGFKKILELATSTGSVSWLMIFLGMTISFFSALIVIHFFLSFIRRFTLWPFIWYTLILAGSIAYFTLYV
jgi:undecaprenyl-diphosphatase